MTDTFTPEKRSEIMRRVAGKNTGPELKVRRMLHAMGYRFRLHRKDLPGKPDVYLPKYKTAVFVHGCFWHGHEGCKRATIPATRADYWRDKIAGNRKRDAEAQARLAAMGRRCIVVWECELKDPVATAGKLSDALPKNAPAARG